MRFHGAVGYATSEELTPGVWSDVITEKVYFGDVIQNGRLLESASQVPPLLNENVSLQNSFSIVADAEAYENFIKMRYVRWNGMTWTITNVQVRRPRLILTIGDQWNGDTA